MRFCIPEIRTLQSTAFAVFAASASALFIASHANADDATILASCKRDLKLSESGCACVLDKVHATLNEKQRAFFEAAIGGDFDAMQKAQSKLTGNEMMEVATIMTTTPQQCTQ